MAVPLSFRFRTLASVSNTDTIISSETEYPGSFEHYPKQALSGLFSYFFCIGDKYICTDKLACFDKYILLSKWERADFYIPRPVRLSRVHRWSASVIESSARSPAALQGQFIPHQTLHTVIPSLLLLGAFLGVTWQLLADWFSLSETPEERRQWQKQLLTFNLSPRPSFSTCFIGSSKGRGHTSLVITCIFPLRT